MLFGFITELILINLRFGKKLNTHNEVLRNEKRKVAVGLLIITLFTMYSLVEGRPIWKSLSIASFVAGTGTGIGWTEYKSRRK